MQTLRQITFLPALLLACFLLPACDTVNSVERADPVGQKQIVADKRIVFDGDFARRVRVLSVNQAETPSGFLKIQVELQNRSWDRHSFLYKFEWFDLDGIQIDVAGQQAYISKTVEGGESIALVALAPNPKAKDFRLKLIEN